MSEKKRVLVTGLSGVVGTAIRTEFENRYELSSLSRYGTKGIDEEHNFKGNIAEIETLLPAFRDQHTIVHLAADRSATAEWESALRNNFIGTYNVFEAARMSGVKRVVFGSSQHAVGGNYLDEPYCHIMNGEFEKVSRPYPLLDENIRIRPSGYYGASKAYGESLGSYYSDHHGLSVINIRIGFTISTDDPGFGGGALALWLSHNDTSQIHAKAVDAPSSIRYTTVYAMSNNYWSIFSLDKARDQLGYEPVDGAGKDLNPDSKGHERDKTEYKQHYEDPETY
jgi:nucleoside-diphosphate-sugar epimerase